MTGIVGGGMAFATRSRRAARAQPIWTVVPFDARGAGVGEIPPMVAIETPHDGETLLVLCAEVEQPDPEAMRRCLLALDAFRAGYDAAGPRMLTNALIAGMEEANNALYDHRPARRIHRPVAIGLTALVARGADAYIIQAGPGQALIVGAEGITALPPLHQHGQPGSAPLGMLPTIEPDLFHVDAGEGLFAALSVSALGRVLSREDDGPLLACDAAHAADYLVALGTRYRLPQAYGVLCSTTAGDEPTTMLRAKGMSAPPTHHTDDRSFTEAWPAGLPLTEEPIRQSRYAPAPAPQGDEDEPRWEYLGEQKRPTRINLRRGVDTGAHAGAWDDPYRPPRTAHLRQLPPRLSMLASGFLLALALAAVIGIVHAFSSHRANSATLHELNGIATARAQAVALPDPQAQYTALTAVSGQLARVATEGRQTKRVAQEQQALAQALDMATNVTRVTPRPVATLPHLDAAPGSHRLLLAGDDGNLYLFDRDKTDWGVYAINPTTQKPERLFTTGDVANKVPAGDVRGLLWVGGPATTDRTRLFARTASGGWGELAIPALAEKRPTAIVTLNDGLYLLDSTAGVILRVPFVAGSGAKPWTTDAATAELKTAVDMTSDGQTIWVLLADGRVRGFAAGVPAQVIAAPVIPPLKEPTAITTSASSPYLYVADGAQGRILRVRKADGRLMQVLRGADGAPPITPIQSLTVDEGKGMLWYVTADGIVTIPLPPVRGA